jgi:lauroyl/myristoyl acyltransferase
MRVDLEALRYLYLRRVIGTAIRVMGIEAADRFARAVGRRFFALNSPGRRRAVERVRTWLDLSAREGQASDIVQSMYEHTGRFWVESLYVSRLLRQSSWREFVRVHQMERWDELARSPGGCLIATAYFGHVGVLAYALGQVFRPLYVVADAFGESSLGDWQRDLFRAEWVEPIDRRRAALELPILLERGEAVMIVAEAERVQGRACEAEFLGSKIRAYPTLARLSQSFDAPIVPAVCSRRTAPFRFDVRASGAVEFGQWNDDREVMAEVLSRIERLVADRPEQYLWSTPRLADRPVPKTETPRDARVDDLVAAYA